MKILITGYKGFIGQNMVNAFRDQHELSLFEWGEPLPKIQGLDWVIHLGAITSTTEPDVEKVMRQNYDFSCILLETCLKEKVNFQYASSASVYGVNSEFREDSPPHPQSPYAWSKYLFDRHVTATKFDNICVQGFRYFNVYGPHEEHKRDQASPYYKFAKQAKDTGVIKLFKGSENYFRDFVSVEEVIRIHTEFFTVDQTGIWNLGTGKIKSFQEVAEYIAKEYSAKIEYISIPENIARQYQAYTKADLTKLHHTLNAKSHS